MRHLDDGVVLAFEPRHRTRALELRQLLAAEDRNHPRARHCRADVNRDDLGVRPIGAQKTAVGLPRQIPIRGETPLSGQKTVVLAPAVEFH
jgi:hypothetical protein